MVEVSGGGVADHGHQRGDPASRAHQHQGSTVGFVPGEVSERPLDRQHRAHRNPPDQHGRDPAPGDFLDGQVDGVGVGPRRGRRRIGLDRRIRTAGGDLHVEVLPGEERPAVRHRQAEGDGVGRLDDDLADRARLPALADTLRGGPGVGGVASVEEPAGPTGNGAVVDQGAHDRIPRIRLKPVISRRRPPYYRCSRAD